MLRRQALATMIINFTVITFFLSSCGFAQRVYEVVLEVDKDGKAISGTKAMLISDVTLGNPIRIGWELVFRFSDATIFEEHWADAGVINIHIGNVFAQVASIFEQSTGHYSRPPQVFLYPESTANDWVAILGTNGVMKQRFEVKQESIDFIKKKGLSDEEVEKQNKDREPMRVNSRWAALR